MNESAYPIVPPASCAALLELSDRDRAVFFDVLVNPPPLSERLLKAFADHKLRIRQGPREPAGPE